jgi:hypothetical protein
MIRALLLLTGAVLLLPGLCSLGLMSSMLIGALRVGPSPLGELASGLPILLITLAIGWGGVILIRKALRPPPAAPRGPSKGQMP